MKPIHVLARVDALDDLGLADMLRQRQLNQDPVHRLIRIQGVDAREQLDLARRLGQVDRHRMDAALFAGSALVAHVHGRGGVVPDHHDRKPRTAAPGGHPPVDGRTDLGLHHKGDGLAVDDFRGALTHDWRR